METEEKKIALKVSEIIGVYKCISGLEKTEVTFHTKTWSRLFKIQRELKPIVEDRDKVMNALLKRLGETSDGGNTYSVPNEKMEEYNKEAIELAESEHDYVIKKTPMSELRGHVEKMKAFDGIGVFYEYLIEE